ncbi:MAG: biotin/lipoyl-binding protein [Bryobacterales bacterium]|nr:biotin/lipoyl-binding protein [Bryobacterales bacterium]
MPSPACATCSPSTRSSPPSPRRPAPSTTARSAPSACQPASETISISVAVPGLVTQVAVKAGDHVRKGQTLFTLDDRDLRAELALRASNTQLAESRLQRLRSAPRPEDIPPAEARVREAEALLRDAQVQLDLIAGVRDKRAVRKEEVERREKALEAAQARLAGERAALARLKAGTWAPDLAIAEAELRVAREQESRLRADLDRLTVRSPISGEVLQCKVRPGEYAQAGPLAEPLLLLGDTSRLHIRTKDAWSPPPCGQAGQPSPSAGTLRRPSATSPRPPRIDTPSRPS